MPAPAPTPYPDGTNAETRKFRGCRNNPAPSVGRRGRTRQRTAAGAWLSGCRVSRRSVTLRRIMSTLLRLSSLFVLGFQAAPTEPGWTSLFNGKDFTGWKVVTPASWTIKDGAIVANGIGRAMPTTTATFKNHMFRNFELKVDVMAQAEFKRRRLRADRIPGDRRSRPGIGPLSIQGLRDPGEQHLHTDPVQDRQPVSRQDVHDDAPAERRRVVHRDHHGQRATRSPSR